MIVPIPDDGRALNILAPTAYETGLQLGTLIVVLAVTLAIVIAVTRGRETV